MKTLLGVWSRDWEDCRLCFEVCGGFDLRRFDSISTCRDGIGISKLGNRCYRTGECIGTGIGEILAMGLGKAYYEI